MRRRWAGYDVGDVENFGGAAGGRGTIIVIGEDDPGRSLSTARCFDEVREVKSDARGRPQSDAEVVESADSTRIERTTNASRNTCASSTLPIT